jgi:hypothetical protein
MYPRGVDTILWTVVLCKNVTIFVYTTKKMCGNRGWWLPGWVDGAKIATFALKFIQPRA